MAEVPRNAEEGVLQRRTPQRLFELDALRGIAAFTVIWHHLRFALPGDPLHHKLLYPLFAGFRAVILFFVLSGYVLSLPIWRGKQLPYLPYLVRRFFRIYVPYFAALLVAWAAASHFLYAHPAAAVTPWFYETWHTPLTGRLFLRELLMSTIPDINTAFWSLHYEMEMSILFPLLCRLLGWLSTRMAIAAMVILMAAGTLLGIRDLSYATCFLAGALLSIHHEQIKLEYALWSRGTRVALAVASVSLFYLPVPETMRHANDIMNIVATMGSVGLIVLGLNSAGFGRVLRNPVFEYLGRISFSLYLVHGTVLFILLDTLYGKVSLSTLVIALGLTCWAAAHVFCVLVEDPAMRLGKRLTGMRNPDLLSKSSPNNARSRA